MSAYDVTVFESAELARRAALADHAAFAELYRRHGPGVYGLCLRMTRDADEAEELVQGIFVRAWMQLGQFDDGNFAVWLNVLARHFVLSDIRTRSRLARRVTNDNQAVLGASGATMVSQETLLTIEEAVAGLSPARRTVFMMHDVDGFGTGEIAQCLGIAASTVRVHLAEARRLVARMLRC